MVSNSGGGFHKGGGVTLVIHSARSGTSPGLPNAIPGHFRHPCLRSGVSTCEEFESEVNESGRVPEGAEVMGGEDGRDTRRGMIPKSEQSVP